MPDARLLRIKSGEQRGARRTAARGVIELREAHTALRQRIQRRRGDFTPIATEVGLTDIVGHDENDVRPLGGNDRNRTGEQRADNGE